MRKLQDRNRDPSQKKRNLGIRPLDSAETANAFVLGLIFNQAQRAEQAWSGPYRLAERIGTLDPRQIILISEIKLAGILAIRPVIHPFTGLMASHIRTFCELILERYSGDSRNIWIDTTSAKEVDRRLKEFGGIGPHKANVGVFLLAYEHGMLFSDSDWLKSIHNSCPKLYDIYKDILPNATT